METACLRLKFTPILNQTHNENSKFCVEIVPEVSCIQNFDKIEWNEGNDFVEYNIPITYRIILKKRQIKNNQEEIVKTYHSCLDLPLPSSVADLSLGSGDDVRIASDTLILTKLTALIPNYEDTIPSRKEHGDNKIEIYEKVLDKMTNTSIYMSDIVLLASEESDNKVTTTTDLQAILENSQEKEFIDKTTETKSVCNLVTQAPFNERVVTYVSGRTTLKHDENTLNLTQMYSESQECISKTTAKPINKLPAYFNNRIVPVDGSCTPYYDSYNKICISKYFPLITETTKSISDYSNRFNSRILPETRISQYVRIMQKEIRPLKLMLNEIINKCKHLGVISENNPSSTTLMYKIVPAYKSMMTETQVQEKSNRVVYSIFFHE